MDNIGELRHAYRWRRIKVMSFHIRSTFGDVLEVEGGGLLWDIKFFWSASQKGLHSDCRRI